MKKRLTCSLISVFSFFVCLPMIMGSENKATKTNAENPISYQVTTENFVIDPLTKDSNRLIYFTLPDNGMNKSVEADNDLRFRANIEDAVIHHIKKDGTEVARGVNICFHKQKPANATNLYYIEFNTWKAGENYTVERGESIRIKGTATRRGNGESLVFDEIIIDHTEMGFWGVRGQYSYNQITYDLNDITGVDTHIYHGESDGNAFFLKFDVEDTNAFPVNSAWNAWYEQEDTVTIVKPDGTEITRNGLLMKRSEKTYTLLFPNFTWSQTQAAKSYYEFQGGEIIKARGTYTSNTGSDYVSITLDNLEFTFDGQYFSCHRESLVVLAAEKLEQLQSEVSFTSDYLTFVADTAKLVSSLTSQEAAGLDPTKVSLLFKQERLIAKENARVAGKTIHESTILTNEISATEMSSVYDTGAVFVHNPIDFVYTVKSKEWDVNYRGKKDSYFLASDGTKTIIDSAIVIYHPLDENKQMILDKFHGVFIFEKWTKPTSTEYKNLKPGDRYIVRETGYIYETETDFYLVNFEGCDFTWTGSVWIDTVTAPNLQSLIAKVNDIGTVTYTQECKAKIDEAKLAYESLSETERKYVSADIVNLIYSSEREYQRLEMVSLADAVSAKIDAIGTVTTDDACKAKIDEAREALNNLPSGALDYVPQEKISILENAELTYLDLVDTDQASAVLVLINAIGEVSHDDACKERIDTARAAYDTLNENAKSKISDEDYMRLFNAEREYDLLGKADEFIEVVNTLNDNMTANEMYSVIIQAKALYDKIDDKTSVSDAYNKLISYVNKYNELVKTINEHHEKTSENALSIVLNVTALLTTLAAGLALVSKKGF